jgi:predicted lysophospholipase L1 biosynthesis ABC-type transport system permease subunit
MPIRNVVRIAWRNIRFRPGRSVLLAGVIALAVAFLTNVLCSDAILRNVAAAGNPDLVMRLQAEGRLSALDDADARVQSLWLAGLALLVCFVGILNTMLLSVTERTGEIGTMKCLGALDSLIVKLFLLESFFQGVVGTAAGVAAGLLLAIVQGWAACGSGVWALLPAGRLATLALQCLGAGAALTVGAAVYPTWRAARMQPVEAMRKDV